MIRNFIILFSLLNISLVQAAELTDVGKQVSDKAEKQVQLTERVELMKAKEAAAKTKAREQDILQHQPTSPWEAQEREKAAQQFSERKEREAKYLQEAKEAAAKEHKMDKPKMKIIKRKSEEN